MHEIKNTIPITGFSDNWSKNTSHNSGRQIKEMSIYLLFAKDLFINVCAIRIMLNYIIK